MTLAKSEIFSRAWTKARTAALRFGGRPVEYFADALRGVYAAANSVAGKLVALGGREWKKPEIGKHRVYFDDANRFAGLALGDGGVRYINGQHVSNNEIRRSSLSGLYYDMLDQKFHISAGSEEWLKAAATEIRRLAGI